MARCEDCIHEKVCLHRVNIQTGTYAYMGVKYDTEKCKHFKPTADVVPKSRVEALEDEVNRYKRYYFRHDYDEMIAEVLDKLDRFINSNCIEIKDERGIKGYVTSGVHFAIAELKKKYTGGATDEIKR